MFTGPDRAARLDHRGLHAWAWDWRSSWPRRWALCRGGPAGPLAERQLTGLALALSLSAPRRAGDLQREAPPSDPARAVPGEIRGLVRRGGEPTRSLLTVARRQPPEARPVELDARDACGGLGRVTAATRRITRAEGEAGRGASGSASRCRTTPRRGSRHPGRG